MKIVLSSTELKAQISFFWSPLVRLSVNNLAQRILGGKVTQGFGNKGPFQFSNRKIMIFFFSKWYSLIIALGRCVYSCFLGERCGTMGLLVFFFFLYLPIKILNISAIFYVDWWGMYLNNVNDYIDIHTGNGDWSAIWNQIYLCSKIVSVM